MRSWPGELKQKIDVFHGSQIDGSELPCKMQEDKITNTHVLASHRATVSADFEVVRPARVFVVRETERERCGTWSRPVCGVILGLSCLVLAVGVTAVALGSKAEGR